MPPVGGRHLSIDIDLANGIAIRGIRDAFTRHEFLAAGAPADLFAFAVNNGPLRHSFGDTETLASNAPDSSTLTVRARGRDENVGFELRVSCANPNDDQAVVAHVAVVNHETFPIFLRVVMPLVRGIVTPGNAVQRRFVVPQELGAVVADTAGPGIGMELNLDVGLPTSMNSMELACFYDAAGGGGVFFADLDGDVEQGVSPLQMVAWPSEVNGFWIALLQPGQSVNVPRLAIGVHHGGDWREAVDYYTAHHRPRWRFTDSPAWFREQGALYTFGGGGAGGVLMSQVGAPLPDGAVWTTWQIDDGPWRDGLGDRPTVQVSTAGLAPAGAALAALARDAHQVDVFVAGYDGAIWTTWQRDDGPWRTGILGRYPARITPPCATTPGTPLAAARQLVDQMDVFYVGRDGAVWVTWERDDGLWRDGGAARLPQRITPPGLAPEGAHLVAVHQNAHQLNVFVVGIDGAIWVTWAVDDGPWRDGADGRDPRRVTPAGFAPPGAPLAAAHQRADQLNVFVVRDDGAIWGTFEANDGPWTDGNDGRHPERVSPVGFAPPRAHLAASLQNEDQLDVFAVRADGAIWVTFEANDGPWTDGNDGRQPFQVSAPNLAPPGAWLSAVFQNSAQLDVIVAGHGNALRLTWEVDDLPWSDGLAGRPEPALITSWNMAPAGGGVATASRASGQLDAFFVGQGSLKSFRDLPVLLEEARALGTELVYLYDWWEGTDAGGFPAYWNKGDYVPRSDLGGEPALVDGIRALHEKLGRLIVYVEPFIIYQHSEIGRALGEAWAARRPQDDELHSQYPSNYTMVAPMRAWQDYVVAVCERLVCHYGVDGIFLDSYGWQMNVPMTTTVEGRLYPPLEHARGVLQLIDRVRNAIRRLKPDAVVLGETASGPAGRHMDGGLSADFATPPWTSLATMRGRLRGSPVRYGVPEVRFFGNGKRLGELHQVYAAGHGLALAYNRPGSFTFDHAAHIKALVMARRTYRDALIDGPQDYEPRTDRDEVSAYYYRGATHQILIVVNTAEIPMLTALELRQTETNAVWRDLLTTDRVVELTTAGTRLSVLLDVRDRPSGIAVLRRVR